MTTNNHPAHGPVSLDRLHQIREHLLHDTQYSNGGNRAYILADVLKVIDGAIAAFGAEPVGTFKKGPCGYYSSFHEDAVPLYTVPHPAPVVPLPDAVSVLLNHLEDVLPDDAFNLIDVKTWNAVSMLTCPDACRAAMQSFGNSESLDEVGSWNNHRNTPTAQAGNSPVIGIDMASEPDRSVEVRYLAPPGYAMVPKKLTAENGAKGVLSGEFSETKFINCPECFGDDDCETCDGSGRIEITVPVTWTTIKAIWDKGIEHFSAAPQQEVKS
ncbi:MULTISPECIES: hypothetical protein [unclassified Citrobacter]|uniref:hypothetical protein n=1 Tax=unclassified Citrobacter TaxID=2644389 RepID=UPI00227C5086|nr:MULTISPECIES: hypothetical protein [unclassified Citrobacter]MDM3311228.1 hypothetical protein [Citrobacter sp. Cb223]